MPASVLKIQLAIVSQESLANLIPCIKEKPDLIVLLASDEFSAQAEQLGSLIEGLDLLPASGIEIRSGLPSSGLEAIQDFALMLEDELSSRYPSALISYNATGGNKLMALAFSEVFRGVQREIIYCDTFNDALEVLSPDDQPARPLENVLDVRTTLKAMGKTLRKIDSEEAAWQQRALARKQQTYWLVEQVMSQDGNIGFLNGRIHEASRDVGVIDNLCVTLGRSPGKTLKALLKNFQAAGVLMWLAERNLIMLLDEQAKVYLTGGWLEEYVWLEATAAGASEVYCGVSFTDDQYRKQNIRNEMDLIVQHHNRLLFVECKTSRFGRNQQADSGIIYKLDSLSSQAGLFCNGVLVTARPLNHDTRSGYQVRNAERARSHKIYPVEAADIRTFRQVITRWMKTGFLPRD